MEKFAASAGQASFLLSIMDPDPGAGHRRTQLAAGINDWNATLNLVRRHRLLPLLFRNFPGWQQFAGAEAVAHANTEYLTNTVQNLAIAAELLDLLNSFDTSGIPAMPFKGIVLAASLYGDIRCRTAGDIDILIYPRDLKRATAAMLSNGYKLRTPAHDDFTPVDQGAWEYQFRRDDPEGAIVELCWRPSPASFRRELGMEFLWPRRRAAILLETSVASLRPEDTLVLLCMHGTKHHWRRLLWIADVSQLILSNPGLDWDDAERTAKRFGLFRTLGLGILLSYRMGGAPVPDSIVRRFERVAAIRGLEFHTREHFFDAARIPYPGLPFGVQVLELGDRIKSLAGAALQHPQAHDRAAVPLPAALGFLHHLIRPVRLGWRYFFKVKRSAAGRGR